MQKLPVYTDDSNLALCLNFCGHPVQAVWNEYTPEKLKSLGFATVKQAVAAGKAGNVRYFFHPSEELAKLVSAYYDQRKRVQTGEVTESAAEAEDVMRILCTALVMRKEFVALWRKVIPKYSEGGERRDIVEEEEVVTAEMVKQAGGRFIHDGKEYKVGERFPIKGRIEVSPFKCVPVTLNKSLRQQIGL